MRRLVDASVATLVLYSPVLNYQLFYSHKVSRKKQKIADYFSNNSVSLMLLVDPSVVKITRKTTLFGNTCSVLLISFLVLPLIYILGILVFSGQIGNSSPAFTG